MWKCGTDRIFFKSGQGHAPTDKLFKTIIKGILGDIKMTRKHHFFELVEEEKTMQKRFFLIYIIKVALTAYLGSGIQGIFLL